LKVEGKELRVIYVEGKGEKDMKELQKWWWWWVVYVEQLVSSLFLSSWIVLT